MHGSQQKGRTDSGNGAELPGGTRTTCSTLPTTPPRQPSHVRTKPGSWQNEGMPEGTAPKRLSWTVASCAQTPKHQSDCCYIAQSHGMEEASEQEEEEEEAEGKGVGVRDFQEGVRRTSKMNKASPLRWKILV